MSDGLSDTNRETDYGFDPVFGICNACGKSWCDCAVTRIRELESALAAEKARTDALVADLKYIDDATLSCGYGSGWVANRVAQRSIDSHAARKEGK